MARLDAQAAKQHTEWSLCVNRTDVLTLPSPFLTGGVSVSPHTLSAAGPWEAFRSNHSETVNLFSCENTEDYSTFKRGWSKSSASAAHDTKVLFGFDNGGRAKL